MSKPELYLWTNAAPYWYRSCVAVPSVPRRGSRSVDIPAPWDDIMTFGILGASQYGPHPLCSTEGEWEGQQEGMTSSHLVNTQNSQGAQTAHPEEHLRKI